MVNAIIVLNITCSIQFLVMKVPTLLNSFKQVSRILGLSPRYANTRMEEWKERGVIYLASFLNVQLFTQRLN